MRLVMDVKTMPGFGFDIDHRMVKVKLRLPPCSRRFGVTLRPSVMKETRVPRLQIGRLTAEAAGQINTKLQDSMTEGLLDDYTLWSYAVR